MTVEELLAKYEAGMRDFSGIDLSEANLRGVQLSEANFSHANFSIVNMSGANLSGSNLRHAQLNVARLRGAHLTQANLNHATLNVANLIRADLSRAQLQSASLIRAELIRADLSRADLMQANLSKADLRGAALRHALLKQANLNEANLKDAFLTGANLEGANLSNTDLSKAELSGANFRDAEMRQANLSHADLTGANLSGTNLRWADLTGANLRWADLSGAKLSGANLIGADLSNANLTNTSLVHADLTQAKLMKVEWIGADLSGATLTGSKLYATSRFGLKTEGMICEWVDLSPAGDRSIIQNFNAEETRDFFNETLPTIRIIVDKPLDPEANFAIAGAYYQIAQQYQQLQQPPSMEIGRRRTVFTFRVDSDVNLFSTAYLAILPFQDAEITQDNIHQILAIIFSEKMPVMAASTHQHLQQLTALVETARENANTIKQAKNIWQITAKLNFFQAPTQIILTNSSAQSLNIHYHHNFGKKFIDSSDVNTSIYNETAQEAANPSLPSTSLVIDFIKGFHYIG
ncbi:MAG: pentapeptide repeat-containing protein [Chlorogloeopsis fritschii C42_A2020_084]|uniref:pentapeptide repeat-containing protein n=1 Tax=Chlorogloeopsis fritschii TaxID=1124 RepID=UPI001A020814|nr:pentapeptide repeat-containing protein [Chlorogloeopsis fritschii]MBF2008358.1 pentapeptide repeat-containing protein [Chlorogloeopsis fritschii C42_A2020_084]